MGKHDVWLKRICASGLVGTSAALLWHYGMIVKYGKFYIHEPNSLILALEIVMVVSLLVVGAVTLFRGE